jgi:hypothetical protein
MIFGMSVFTSVHVLLSLVGIISGLMVAVGLVKSEARGGWTALFLASTIATSVTGFFFPFDRFLPSHWVGVLSLILLAAAVLGRYVYGLAGAWRWIYVATAMAALYFNVFVLVVQVFQKFPALHALAPTQSEPPFAITQGIVLLLFVALGIVAARAFHPRGGMPA